MVKKIDKDKRKKDIFQSLKKMDPDDPKSISEGIETLKKYGITETKKYPYELKVLLIHFKAMGMSHAEIALEMKRREGPYLEKGMLSGVFNRDGLSDPPSSQNALSNILKSMEKSAGGGPTPKSDDQSFAVWERRSDDRIRKVPSLGVPFSLAGEKACMVQLPNDSGEKLKEPNVCGIKAYKRSLCKGHFDELYSQPEKKY